MNWPNSLNHVYLSRPQLPQDNSFVNFYLFLHLKSLGNIGPQQHIFTNMISVDFIQLIPHLSSCLHLCFNSSVLRLFWSAHIQNMRTFILNNSWVKWVLRRKWPIYLHNHHMSTVTVSGIYFTLISNQKWITDLPCLLLDIVFKSLFNHCSPVL